MTKYKLSYFNFRGRAEPIRMLFHLSGVEFEDERWALQDWIKIKSETPWGSGPVLEMDGEKLAQTTAILLYLGKKFGHAGKSAWEEAKCAELINALNDAGDSIRPSFMIKDDEAQKEQLLQKGVTEGIEPFYQKLVKILQANGTGYFVGDGLTVADLSLCVWLQGWDEGVIPGVLEKFPELANFVRRIEAIPKVREWIEKRPECPFSIVSKPKQKL